MMRFLGYGCCLTACALAACSGGGAHMGATPQTSAQTAAAATHVSGMQPTAASSSIFAQPGYTVTVFARGSSTLTKPDAIVAAGGYTYVAYQNATTPTGGGGNSTLVKYREGGIVSGSVQVPGRIDGMRFNPSTRLMWITVNEDGNSSLYTWNPGSNALQHFHFSSAAHGGGYDDLAFIGGKAFVAASNPTLDPSGINTGPALVSVALVGTTAKVTPVLYGNASARDIPSGATVKLNLTDPDSLAIAPNGDVVLVSQGDSELIFIHDAGLAGQRVSRLPVGTQLDDTTYPTESDGLLYVVDAKANAIYVVRGPLVSGAIYSQAPSDSTVAGFVGTVNAQTGTVTPVVTGFGSPTGLIFVADRDVTTAIK